MTVAHTAARMSLPARLMLPMLAAVALVGVAPPSPVHAADGLEIVTAATYRLLPEQGRVHVEIDARATSREPDGADGRVISGVTFSVQPGIANVRATSAGAAIPAAIERRADEFTDVSVTFGRTLRFGESYRYAVGFDLVDPGGAAGRDIRIGRSVVAFPVWAFGSSNVPGGSVTVEVPTGYNVSVEGTQMTSTDHSDGSTTLRVSSIPDPYAFFAYLSADRPGAFEETPVAVSLGGRTANVHVRFWEDDPDWGKRMESLLGDGLPVLHDLIGLPYTIGGPLNVEEAATSRLGEYAGIYNNVADTITVRYDADAYVALHEAAHIWFNQQLFPDRWIGEAFAEFYAVQAGQQIGAKGETFTLDDNAMKHRIALNSWGAVGVEDLAVEDYAYAATYRLATLIADRTDLAGLRKVWKAAADDELAYLPAHDDVAPGISVAVTQKGWQKLLDLLEERTGKSFDDLWDEWVVDDADRPLLDERKSARATYQALVAEAGTWELPHAIRYDMGSWNFADAREEMASADEILLQRNEISSRAGGMDLAPPPTLESVFEGSRGLAAASDEARAELATLDAIASTTQLLAIQPSVVETIGLLGDQPQHDLDAARTSFESGDLAAADHASARASLTRTTAVDEGRFRVAVAGGGLLGLDLLVMTALGLRRRSQRRRFERLQARVNPPTFST
jgi:hypothetical protein